MTIIRNYNYGTTKVTAMAVDTNSGEFLWVGYAINSNSVCKLRKVSAHNPSQIYYEIDLSVSEIKSIHILGTNVYVAVDDSSYIMKAYSCSTPLSTSTSISLPVGANEAPIATIDDGTYLFTLLPGVAVGENAKIYKHTTAGTLIDTIDLPTITNALSFTIDSNDNIWVVTKESPSKLVRVYEISGGIYTYSITVLS